MIRPLHWLAHLLHLNYGDSPSWFDPADPPHVLTRAFVCRGCGRHSGTFKHDLRTDRTWDAPNGTPVHPRPGTLVLDLDNPNDRARAEAQADRELEDTLRDRGQLPSDPP